jgi:5-methylcytosine-specific restriction endonuclease McrA
MTKTKDNGRDEFGRFVNGRKSERKGKPFPQIREENHYKWTGGSRGIVRTIALRYGFNLSKCSICRNKDRTVVHHVDENPKNNELKNLRILCFRCHNQLHGCGIETRFKKGHKVSKEIRKKISMANKGKIAWNKGRLK